MNKKIICLLLMTSVIKVTIQDIEDNATETPPKKQKKKEKKKNMTFS